MLIIPVTDDEANMITWVPNKKQKHESVSKLITIFYYLHQMYSIEHAWLPMKACAAVSMHIEDEVKEHLPNIEMLELEP
jgi:hypothetical protein